jgi:hypothetical protein
MSQQAHVERFLMTGENDVCSPDWPGATFVERAGNAGRALRHALIAAVKERTQSAKMPLDVVGLDVEQLARRKISPMVRGLFADVEQQPIIDMLSQSVVFLTASSIEEVIASVAFLQTAWNLANLYLLSRGASLLSEEAVTIVGISEERTCYLSTAYLQHQSRFEDVLVHEAAHVFHNCKAETLGLSGRGRREWLLSIDYHKREIFAYACEAYSRIVDLALTRSERMKLAADLTEEELPPDGRVDALAALIQRMSGIRWRMSHKSLILLKEWVSTPLQSPDQTEPHPPCLKLRPRRSAFQPLGGRKSLRLSMAGA